MDLRAHLISRGCDPSVYHVLLDEEKGIATFPLFNLSGAFVGYQQYNPLGDKKLHHLTQDTKDQARYYTYVGREGDPGRAEKRLAVWGLDSLQLGERILFITEGIFDAVKVRNAGMPCIAVLSNNPQPLKPWFMALGRLIIGIRDHDEAGQKLASVSHLSFTVPDGHNDLGEMQQEQVDRFIWDIVGQLSSRVS